MRPMQEKSRPPVDRKRLLERLGELDQGELAAEGIDAQKVARIRKALEDGTLKVDAGAVADAMLARVQALLDRRKR